MNRFYIAILFAILSWGSALAQDIVKLEYFIDTDPGYGSATDVPVTAGPNVDNFTFTVPMTSVADGFHALFIRSKDSNDKWSVVQGRPFVKHTLTVPSEVDVTRIECFIDTDPGFGNGATIDFEAGPDVTNLSFTVPLDMLSEGFHRLFVRSRDANNKWSLVQVRPFVNINIAAPGATDLTRIEYFIDTDPGTGNGVTVDFQQGAFVTDLSFSVSLESVNDGFHTLFVRSQDVNNHWSVLQSRPFVKLGVPEAASEITLVEYFVDTDPGYGSGTSVPITPALSIPDLSFQVDLTSLTEGPHMLFVRSKDADGTWSLVYKGDFNVCGGPAPVAAAASGITTTTFTANWTTVAGATEYRIDVSTDNFATFVAGYDNKQIAGNVTSYEITGLTSDTQYKYKVRAVGATCTSINSNEIEVTTLPAPPALPLATAATDVEETSFTANWSSSVGATSYLLDVSDDNFATTLSGYNSKELVNLSEPVSGLTPETQYAYRVRAKNVAGLSEYSNVIAVTTDPPSSPPPVPTATAATMIAQTTFTANWDFVPGAATYQLEISSDNFVNSVPGYENLNISGTHLQITGLTAGTQYKYRVRSVNVAGASANSNEITVTTLLVPPPAAPIALAAFEVTGFGFIANWEEVPGATEYRIDVSADEFVNFVAGYQDKSVTGAPATILGLDAATTYKYRVRAVDINGTSENSNEVSVTTMALPGAPVAAAATGITTTGFTANWGSVAEASHYQFEVSADNFATNLPGYDDKELFNLSDEITGLDHSTLYKYRVRAVNANGTSVYSNVINVTTLSLPSPPTATAATGVTSAGFTANWTTVAGATGYRLDVSDDNFVNVVPGYNGKEVINTSEVLTGLTASTAYKYRVRSVNANGTSANSNAVGVTTLAKQNQTIAFGAIPDKTIGDAAFSLIVTATSGLDVTLTTTDHVNVAGATATLVHAGKATITASQAGNDVFNPANSVVRQFCISPAKPTITLTNANTETPVLTSSAPSGNQWYKDGEAISSATSATLQVNGEGVYTVQSTVETCASVMSNDFPVIVTGDIAPLTAQLILAPNPAQDILVIQLPGEGHKEVQIYQSTGAATHSFTTQRSEEQVNVRHYAGGIYFVRVVTTTGSYFGRFIKK